MSGGEFQESHSVLVDGGDRFGVSAVIVDWKEELVWMGNSGVSWHMADMLHIYLFYILGTIGE